MLANKRNKCWQIKNWLQQGSNLGAQGESQRALPLRYSSMFGCTRAHFYLNQIQLTFFSIPPPSPCSFLNPLIPSRAPQPQPPSNPLNPPWAPDVTVRQHAPRPLSDKMQPHESPEAAAARAVREELGARARARIHAEVVDGVPEDGELETEEDDGAPASAPSPWIGWMWLCGFCGI